MQYEEKNFDDLTPVEVPFRYKGRHYVLKEASAEAGRLYRNAGTRAARMDDGRVIGVEGAADVMLVLVGACSFERVEISGKQVDRPVPAQTVKEWPDAMVSWLFDEAKKISPQLDAGVKATAETLRKQKAKIEEQLAELETGDEADPSKNSHVSTTAASE